MTMVTEYNNNTNISINISTSNNVNTVNTGNNDNTGDNGKNYLMLCELHYPAVHGKTADSDPHIETHYLVYDRFDPITGISYSCLDDEEYNTDEEYDSDGSDNNYTINDSITFLKNHYANPSRFNRGLLGNHPTIRNYHNIISRQNYIKPEIGTYIMLPTQEAVAILKTFWLRIIQRKWKKVFQERKNMIRNRLGLYSLYMRQITGNWPKEFEKLPCLTGMLKELTN
jgi:hypothetical protein